MPETQGQAARMGVQARMTRTIIRRGGTVEPIEGDPEWRDMTDEELEPYMEIPSFREWLASRVKEKLLRDQGQHKALEG